MEWVQNHVAYLEQCTHSWLEAPWAPHSKSAGPQTISLGVEAKVPRSIVAIRVTQCNAFPEIQLAQVQRKNAPSCGWLPLYGSVCMVSMFLLDNVVISGPVCNPQNVSNPSSTKSGTRSSG